MYIWLEIQRSVIDTVIAVVLVKNMPITFTLINKMSICMKIWFLYQHHIQCMSVWQGEPGGLPSMGSHRVRQD